MAGGAILAVYLRLGSTAELFTWRYSWYRLLLVPVVLEITFYYSDLHNFRISRPALWTVARVAQALALGEVILAVIYYLVPALRLGRGVMLLSYFTTLGLVLVWRGVYGWALRQRLLATRLMIVGSGSLADAILEELTTRADNVYDVVCILDVGYPPDEPPELNLAWAWAGLLKAEVRREVEELVGLVRYHNVDLIVVAMDERRGQMPLEQLLRCKMLGVPVMMGEDFFEAIAGRLLASRIRPGWLVFSPGFSTSTLRRYTKRAMDLAMSVIGLVLASPIMLLSALAIVAEDGLPVLYKQQRVGQNENVFVLYKFRSMRKDAEADTGPTWAREDDPRVTRVGRVLRKLRIDELPQLVNVLKGEMSFVGPRPERPFFVKRLEQKLPYYRERHNVKPGITGWAQVCYPYGASEAAALEKLNYDLYYIKHSSLSMDVMIIIQTIKIMLFGGGGR